MIVFDYLMDIRKKKGAGYLPLIDPEKASDESFEAILDELRTADIDGILVGGSTLKSVDLDGVIKRIKSATEKPVIIFPGGHYQVSQEADAIFFLSLLSGRNPQFLIEEQVKAALSIKECSLETIPVAYLLIESGNRTSVECVSRTKSLPRDNIDQIVSHALAGKYFGMKMCYMDGGSGAKQSVPEEVIKTVKEETSLPLIIGGGIRDSKEAAKKVKAGADFIVTGSIIEKTPYLLKEFTQSIHNE
ncbi:MAG: geranylgeranylglyceryl/heptaprenylglyceryl phosphate synthase [Candidatus Cloacimonadota bacterium]|nr:MAG: geranylgeranylglyceryl/heptaprenylglyceryl phosphate synthase [Candidatus Cloacimonadota bacterium]